MPSFAMTHRWLVFASLAVTACGRDLNIAADTTLTGTQTARNIFITAGTTVTAMADLTLEADGRIEIDGNITAPDESGADIRIIARAGDVIINGAITAGSGRNGAELAGNGQVIVSDLAGDGGNVEITALQGHVIVLGDIVAGSGGNGGKATAEGPGPIQRAESGAGAAGGQIIITAAGNIEVGRGGQGELHAGDGGDGGESSASISTDEASDLRPQGQAFAVSRSGGRGGDVRLALTGNGTVIIQEDAEAGDGGITQRAVAMGGEATAETQTAGRGGDIVYAVSNDTQIQVALVDPSPGDGGDNGLPAAPDQAFALGVATAVARVGAGGDAGLVLSGTTELDAATAGSNGNAQARLGTNSSSSPGNAVFDRTAAPAHEARRP